MSRGIEYQTNDASNGIIMEFYNRLLEFDTTISDSNLFYVSYEIPIDLKDEIYSSMGEAREDGRIGISNTKEIFQGNKIQALTTGVDLPDDKNDMQLLPHESTVNGYIPITVNKGRTYNSTGLTTTFYDTNLSLNDFIFKPWIRLISRNGCFDNKLYTNVTVVFLGKGINSSGLFKTQKSIIRKQYNFYDCIPIDSQNTDNYEYANDSKPIKQKIQWKFNRYEAKLTNIQ